MVDVTSSQLRRGVLAEPANPYRRLLRSAVGRAFRGGPARRLLQVALNDDGTRGWILNNLADRVCAAASFDDVAVPERIDTFADCAWLFAGNVLNHSLARLEFAEAAYLYDLVRGLDGPSVAEIGRYKGGSTFLLAAAGARVVSIDLDAARERVDAPALERALVRSGLRDRVDIVVGDSRSHDAPAASFDVVFLDGDHSYEGVRADFDHWWPLLRPGGTLLLHDAARSTPTLTPAPVAETAGVIRLAQELEGREDLRRVPGAPGSLARFDKHERA